MSPAERTTAVETIHNLRDFGGYAGAGGRVKTGRLYRSAHHGGASEADLARLAELGLVTILDLRRRNEREREPSRRHAGFAAKVIDNDLGDEGTAPHLSFLRAGELTDDGVHAFMISEYQRIPFEERHLDLFRRFFAALAEADGPVLIHCAAGKDRTGLLAALTHHALGVSEEDATADFLLTNTAARIPERAPSVAEALRQTYGRDFALGSVERFMGVHADYLNAARRTIADRHGSMDAYLDQAIGVDGAAIDRLRSRLID